MKHFAKFVVTLLATLSLSISSWAGVLTRTDTISFQFFVPCANSGAGEIVDVSGQFFERFLYNVQGQRINGYYQLRPVNMYGLGETTGVQYHAVGNVMETFADEIPGGTADYSGTFVQNFQLVSDVDSYRLHVNFRFTILDQGARSSIQNENEFIECR